MQHTARLGVVRRRLSMLVVLLGLSSISGSSLAEVRSAITVSSASFDRVAVQRAPDVRVAEGLDGTPPGSFRVLDGDPRTLTVGYETTSCRPYAGADVTETDDRVEIGLRFGRVNERSYLVCHLRALVGTATVHLAAPVGSRDVVVTGSSTIPGPGAN